MRSKYFHLFDIGTKLKQFSCKYMKITSYLIIKKYLYLILRMKILIHIYIY